MTTCFGGVSLVFMNTICNWAVEIFNAEIGEFEVYADGCTKREATLLIRQLTARGEKNDMRIKKS